MSSVFSEKVAKDAEKKAAAAAERERLAAEKAAVAAAKQAEKAAAKAAKEAEKEAEKAAKQAARDEKKAAAAALAAAKAALPKRPVGRPRKNTNTASVSDSVSVHSGPVLGPATVGNAGLVTRTPTLAQLMAEIAELRTRLAAQTAAYTDVCGRLDTIRHTLMV